MLNTTSSKSPELNGSMENCHHPKKEPLSRRQSLVKDAKLETALNKAAQESWKKDLIRDGALNYDLTEEEILLLSRLSKEESNGTISVSLVFSITEEFSKLPQILQSIEMCHGRIKHLETRPSKTLGESFDLLVKIIIEQTGLLNLIKSMRQEDDISVSIIADETLYLKDIWFPKYVCDLDKCNHVLSKFEPDLDSNHPVKLSYQKGFSDPVYRARRKDIADIAFHYKQGQSIPIVHYTDEEIKTWGVVYKQLYKLFPMYACSSFRKSFQLLEEDCDYKADTIPQLQDVSMFLKRKTGFTLRPAAGLVSARDFLASLAFRVFQCTQYIRHSSSPDHSPEPDCIHELLGHVPMLADPAFAAFSQEIGLASLGASDQDIEKLSTIYWFTVEFGLCKEGGSVKAYGAGLLSSYGELVHALSKEPQLLPFEPQITAMQPYQDLLYQDVYFVANSFEDAKEKIRTYVNTCLERKHDIYFDPFSQSATEVDSLQHLETAVDCMKSDLASLTNALRRLQH